MSRWGRLAAVAAVGLLVVAGAVAGYIRDGADGEGAAIVLAALAMVVTGGILVLKVPENALSSLLLIIAAGLGIMTLFEMSGDNGIGPIVGGIALFCIVLPGLGVFLPLWFPTGRPPSPRWRWVGVTAVVGALLIPASWLVVEYVEQGDSGNIEGCSSIGTCSGSLGSLLLLAAVAAAIASLVYRWVRSGVVERLQIKWVVLAFGVFLIGVMAEFGGFQYSIVANVFLPAGLFLIPVTFVIAITRYRLYEIDRILSRTVSYAIVIVVLGSVYLGGLAALTTLLSTDSPLAVAGSTLAAAALFNPLRKRVQAWVDRHFNRSRYDAQRVMADFSDSLRKDVDQDHLVDGWVGVVSETMHPASAGVWVRE
jgi:hypothetical protein